MGNLSQAAMLKGAKVYQGQKIVERNDRVAKYAPLVKRVALHLKARLPPHVDVDDLVQSGMIGLIDAIQNFKDGQGATFETYAAIRIRGAIIDELRQSDWTPRSVHQNSRAIREAMTRLSHEYGRPATDVEIAADLKIDIKKYHQMLLESNTSQVMGIEDTGLTDDAISDKPLSEIIGQQPDDKLYDSLYNSQFRKALAASIDRLPERERNIVSFYYDQELNLREIGLIMGISESRTCQILSQALVRLRSYMDLWANKSTTNHVAKPKEEIMALGAIAKEPSKPKYKSNLFDDVEQVEEPKKPVSKKESKSGASEAVGAKAKAGAAMTAVTAEASVAATASAATAATPAPRKRGRPVGTTKAEMEARRARATKE